jgi:YVTN family beta-propeller protein
MTTRISFAPPIKFMKATILTLLGILFALGVIAAPSETLLVLSKGDHTLAIVDPSNLKVIAKAPIGEDPHEVIASSDGKFAYVSNYGGGRYNTLAVVDLMAHKALPSIDLGPLRGPHGLAFAGGKVWFAAEAAKAVGRYDPAERKIDWIMGTGQSRTHMVMVSEDQTHIYTTNIGSATVMFLDKGAEQREWNATVVPVGKGSEGFDIAPDGRELWTANAGDGTVSIIDIAGRRVVETLQANVRSANRLKFTPDGKLVFISMLNNPDVVVLAADTHKEVKRIKTGKGAAGIQMQPDGSRVFVSCTPDDYVAVINPKTFEIVGRIDAGPHPDGLAWAIGR